MHFEDLEAWMAGDSMMAVIQQEGRMADQTVAMGQQKKNYIRAKVARVKSR